MDGSDPVAISEPQGGEPVPSSGYDEDGERARKDQDNA
jgi:hypothetical protein